jgi:hypothetical protein
MKNLLIAFLLAIVSLQAAAVAVSDYGIAKVKLEQVYAFAANDLADDAETDEDALKASAAIEELSDYLPAVLPIPRATVTPFPSHPAELVLTSIHLPGTKPPPRG